MSNAIEFQGEDKSNADRRTIAQHEPISLRTFTPSQAVLTKSSGVFHYTADGRRLYDYTSGVLVANLGHNPPRWMQRFGQYMGWTPGLLFGKEHGPTDVPAVTMTAYNAVTPIEAQAVKRLLANMQRSALGKKMQTVLWAASGSEAVQKTLWAFFSSGCSGC